MVISIILTDTAPTIGILRIPSQWTIYYWRAAHLHAAQHCRPGVISIIIVITISWSCNNMEESSPSISSDYVMYSNCVKRSYILHPNLRIKGEKLELTSFIMTLKMCSDIWYIYSFHFWILMSRCHEIRYISAKWRRGTLLSLSSVIYCRSEVTYCSQYYLSDDAWWQLNMVTNTQYCNITSHHLFWFGSQHSQPGTHLKVQFRKILKAYKALY